MPDYLPVHSLTVQCSSSAVLASYSTSSYEAEPGSPTQTHAHVGLGLAYFAVNRGTPAVSAGPRTHDKWVPLLVPVGLLVTSVV